MDTEQVREITLNKRKKDWTDEKGLLPGQNDGVPGTQQREYEFNLRNPPLGEETFIELFLKRPAPQSGEPKTLMEEYAFRFLDKPPETETNPAEWGGGGQKMITNLTKQPFDAHMPFQFFPGSRVYDYQTRENGIVLNSEKNGTIEVLSEDGATRHISTLLLKPLGCSIKAIKAGELFYIPETNSVLKMTASNETELEFLNIKTGKNYKFPMKDITVMPVDTSFYKAEAGQYSGLSEEELKSKLDILTKQLNSTGSGEEINRLQDEIDQINEELKFVKKGEASIRTAQEPTLLDTPSAEEEIEEETTEMPAGLPDELPLGTSLPDEMPVPPGVTTPTPPMTPAPEPIEDKTKDMNEMDRTQLTDLQKQAEKAIMQMDTLELDSVNAQIRALLEKYKPITDRSNEPMTPESIIGREWQAMVAPRRDYSILYRDGLKAMDKLRASFGVFVSGIGVNNIKATDDGLKPKTGIVDFSANIRMGNGIDRKLVFRVSINPNNIQLMPFFGDSLGRTYKLTKESLQAFVGTGENVDMWVIEHYPNEP
jgi:cell division septum initiation protein DivIVA